MGTYSTGANGAFSGKVGSVIGSNWRSVDYLRGLSKRKKKGASELQLAQQMRFALCANQLRVIKDVLNLGFSDKKLNKITGYNAAVKIFLSEAVTGEYPNYGIDYSKIKLSKGSLYPGELSVRLDSEIVISWTNDVNDFNSSTNDKLLIIIFNENKKFYKLNDAHTRDEQGISIPLSGNPNDVLHFWSFFVKSDRSVVSDSQYIGTVTVPL